MAIKIPGLKLFKAADARARVFIVMAAISAVGLVAYLVYGYLGGGKSATGPSRVAAAPSEIQTVPGGQMTPEFYRAVVQANQQAAEQAKISGGSAVPSLINIPGQQPGFAQQDCTILCPGDEGANVISDLNNLVKLGKLSAEDAARLIDLANSNVTVDAYAAALDELVRQGKLTPEQARALLDKYKKQYANRLNAGSAQLMDNLIKAGKLPIDTANELLALQKSGLTPEEYAAELNRLVREGKISPDVAAQLLAQYTQQQMQEQAKRGAFGLQQMAKAGQITAEVANRLAELQNNNTPVSSYEAELNRLVAAGKMTPEAAAKLLDLYKKQRAGIGAMGTLSSLVKQEETNATGVLSDMVKNGKLSPDLAKELLALQERRVTPQQYQDYLNKLVAEKKLSPEDAQKLMASYNKLNGIREQAERLAGLQGNNASVGDYTDELKRAVQAGLISPAMAATLLNQYRAAVAAGAGRAIAPQTGGEAPTIETNIPGGSEFAKLQERLQTETVDTAPPPVATTDFTTLPPAPVQVEDAEARNNRLQQLKGAMSSQAGSLINAWQPVVMQHKDGAQQNPQNAKSDADAREKEKQAKDAKAATGRPIIKAGSILYAVLDTTVDSDYPDTPVMATIVQGQYKGAKLLGKLVLAKGQDKISLNFNLMDMEDWPTTKTISAFAIDPDTARTVMASEVDHHYLKRYGAMMATSFLSGYSSAVTQEGESTTGIFGTSTSHPALSPGNKIAVGLGQIGTNMSSIASEYIKTPTTVKVNSGVGLGILFMGDVAK